MSDTPSDVVSPPQRIWSLRLYYSLTLLFLAGLLVRVTVKDQFPLASTLFYATPLGVLVLIGLFQIVWTWRVQSPVWQRRVWLMMTFLMLIWWNQVSWFQNVSPPLPEENVVRFTTLFWNVARKKDLTAAADYIREVDADIVGLVEVVGGAKEWREFWNSVLPEYEVTVMGGGIYVLTKGTSGETIPHDLTKDSRVRELEITLNGRTLTCMIADIESHPLASRKKPLLSLCDLMSRHPDHPLLVMGDFNTPTDSVCFEAFRKEHTLVFEEVGDGFAPTFPAWFPVLTLDQLWINKHIEAIHSTHDYSSASDHRPVKAVLEFK